MRNRFVFGLPQADPSEPLGRLKVSDGAPPTKSVTVTDLVYGVDVLPAASVAENRTCVVPWR